MNFLLPLLIIAITSGVPIDERYPDAKQVFSCDFCQGWDENFDAWPDGWTRRRGTGFPHFVGVQISREPSPVGDRCLRIDLDGAAADCHRDCLVAGDGREKASGLRRLVLFEQRHRSHFTGASEPGALRLGERL